MKFDPRLMLPRVDKCIAALADTLVCLERPGSDAQVHLPAITAFLAATHARMPDYLQIALRILTFVFDAWPLATKGKAFHRLDLADRLDQVNRWERSRLTFRQSLVAFYRSLTMFRLYSELCKEDGDFRAHAKQD
jgi:hypothetical protein